MAITSSAKKALRAANKKRVFNARRKNAVDDASKKFRKAISAKDKAAAAGLISGLYQALDKAAKTGEIKPNKASRAKSRAMASLKKLA